MHIITPHNNITELTIILIFIILTILEYAPLPKSVATYIENPVLYPQNSDETNEINGAVLPIAEMPLSPISLPTTMVLIILYPCDSSAEITSGNAKTKKFFRKFPSYSFFIIKPHLLDYSDCFVYNYNKPSTKVNNYENISK